MINYIKNMFKGTSKNTPLQVENDQDAEKSIFGFLFKNLENFLLLGMFSLIYAIFSVFTEFTQNNALFITELEKRKPFAFTLIFGLMFVEVLLSLATSYFRKHNEWAKSILVTILALVITYYNHVTINEIFKLYPTANAIETKLILCNWLIFGLGEVVSLLMNSKGNHHTKNPLEDIKSELQDIKNAFYTGNTPQSNNQIVDNFGNPITAKTQHNPIGFQRQNQPPHRQAWKTGRQKLANDTQQKEVISLANKGTSQTEISQKTGLSVYIVNRIIKGKY